MSIAHLHYGVFRRLTASYLALVSAEPFTSNQAFLSGWLGIRPGCQCSWRQRSWFQQDITSTLVISRYGTHLTSRKQFLIIMTDVTKPPAPLQTDTIMMVVIFYSSVTKEALMFAFGSLLAIPNWRCQLSGSVFPRCHTVPCHAVCRTQMASGNSCHQDCLVSHIRLTRTMTGRCGSDLYEQILLDSWLLIFHSDR